MIALDAGSIVRFRVRDSAGRTGSSWSIQTARSSGEVYVCHREGARWVKTSFHESGQWHFAVTSAGQALARDSPGYLGIVKNHKEIAPGWLHATRITVACGELRSDWVEHARERDIVEVPADEAFDAVTIDILLGAVGAAGLRIDEAVSIAEIARGDGGLAVASARRMNLDIPVHNALAPQIDEALAGMRNHGWDGTTASRLVIFGGDDDGYLRQIELAGRS